MSEIDPDGDWSFDPELDELERLSNSVIDLIEHKRFGEAKWACRELKRRFPEVIDWIDRTAAVHKARGEVSQAVEHYRQCIDFIENNPDGFDEESKDFYREQIERLQSRRNR